MIYFLVGYLLGKRDNEETTEEPNEEGIETAQSARLLFQKQYTRHHFKTRCLKVDEDIFRQEC